MAANKHDGFTWIELPVVIAIIGIPAPWMLFFHGHAAPTALFQPNGVTLNF